MADNRSCRRLEDRFEWNPRFRPGFRHQRAIRRTGAPRNCRCRHRHDGSHRRLKLRPPRRRPMVPTSGPAPSISAPSRFATCRFPESSTACSACCSASGSRFSWGACSSGSRDWRESLRAAAARSRRVCNRALPAVDRRGAAHLRDPRVRRAPLPRRFQPRRRGPDRRADLLPGNLRNRAPVGHVAGTRGDAGQGRAGVGGRCAA